MSIFGRDAAMMMEFVRSSDASRRLPRRLSTPLSVATPGMPGCGGCPWGMPGMEGVVFVTSKTFSTDWMSTAALAFLHW